MLNQPLTGLLFVLVCKLSVGVAIASDVISPTGAAYVGVNASSEYSGDFAAENLFTHDVTGLAVGAVVEADGAQDWAIVGNSPGYLAFQLDRVLTIDAVFYAQRIGANPNADKVNAISLWASSSSAFVPIVPGSSPLATLLITNQQSGIWWEYPLSVPITGRYFLVKIEQTSGAGGNIGGNELRLGATVPDTVVPELAYLYPPANATVREFTSVEASFSEPVGGVNAADLRINNQPATNLVLVTPSQFIFRFPQPATGSVTVAWAVNSGIHDLSSNSNLFGGGSWSCTLDPNAPATGVIISEFMADNTGDQPTSLHDELGNSPDWIELHNSTASAVDLTGWFLTDSATRLTKWTFPPTVLPARSYTIVFGSNRNTNVAGQLHTSFKLSAAGSYLALVDKATNIVSAFSPTFPMQYPDISYGRDRLDPALTGYFTNATPGAANTTQGAGFASSVLFSHVSGAFVNSFSLTLATADTNSEIRYVLLTNDAPGSGLVANIPTLASPLYTTPIPVAGTIQVRARAFPKQPGFLPGLPRTESFVQLTASAAAFVSDLPVVLLHNLAGGAVPSCVDQNAIVMVFEPVDGYCSLTNPPTLVTRAGINIRGRSTAGFPKSSFAVETWDEYNQDHATTFCGLPEESDWVLYAPNCHDLPLIHNAFAHQVSRDLGRYSPRTRFAEVFVNTSGGPMTFTAPAGGNYNGIYLVEERIKRGAQRVDVESLPLGVTNAALVTGGYLFKFDDPDPDEAAFRAGGIPPAPDGGAVEIYVYPNGPEMVSSLRAAQNNYFTNFLNDFYAALAGPNWTNPLTGYARYFDVEAGIDHHLLNVLFMNADAFRLSGYVHKPRNGRITMGPLWDLDIALGASRYDDRPFNPRSWRGITYDGGTDFFNASQWYNNAWYHRMFTDPDFWQRYIDRYQELRGNLWRTNELLATVDLLADQLRTAQPRELTRWGGSGLSDTSPRAGVISGNGYSHDFGAGSYQGEIDFLKRWLTDRLDFIDTNFVGRPTFSQPGGAITNGFTLSILGAAGQGATIYYTLDGTDPRRAGGSLSPDARVYSGPMVLTNNARVFARARNLSHQNLTGPNNPPLSSPWSGAAVATYHVNVPPLAITEIMYHPAGPPAGSTNDANDFEFIELKNVGPRSQALTGVQFIQGLNFIFNATNAFTNLGPGQYCVLVKNRLAFLSRYPGVTNIAGEYTNSLNSAGERLTTKGALQEPIQDFTFQDSWYPITDGFGFSLVIRNENGPFNSWSDAASWRPSTFAGGSPGYADPPPPDLPAVLINEILTHTDPPQEDTIELWNPSITPAAVGGWLLSDDAVHPFRFRIPTNIVIPAGGYQSFTQTQFGGGPNGFSLSSLGEAVYLFSATGTNLTDYRHGFCYGPQINGVSFGRHITSDGREHLVTETASTFGLANSGPKVGPIVINEIMFAPRPFGLAANALEEYVELQNITGLPVPLYDPAHLTNSWRLDGAVTFTFPPGLVLPPWGRLVVVSFDPEHDPVMRNWFCTRFDLNSTDALVGPFSGQLANEGEPLRLLLPDLPQVAPALDVGFVPYVLVEEVEYSNAPPWPAGADETGNSLQRLASGAFGNDPANWLAASPTPGRINDVSAQNDSDLDGLPDDWELANGFDPRVSSGNNGPLADPDGDGANNWHEFLAGTAPTIVPAASGSSRLRLQTISLLHSMPFPIACMWSSFPPASAWVYGPIS